MMLEVSWTLDTYADPGTLTLADKDLEQVKSMFRDAVGFVYLRWPTLDKTSFHTVIFSANGFSRVMERMQSEATQAR
jgi:hypothetical protein